METTDQDFEAVQQALHQVAALEQQGVRYGAAFKEPAATINAAACRIGYRCRCAICSDCDMAFYLTQAGQAVLAFREQRNMAGSSK